MFNNQSIILFTQIPLIRKLFEKPVFQEVSKFRSETEKSKKIILSVSPFLTIKTFIFIVTVILYSS